MVCCGPLLTPAAGVAAVSASDSGSGPSASVVRVSSATVRESWSTSANSGPAEEPAGESSPGQNRRYVIGALGVGLILLVLLVRRRRGKASIVLRWRKRS